MVMPRGLLNVATGPKPLAEPTAPVPARVVTTPLGNILRISLFPASATYTDPDASTQTPIGLLNWALTPVPFAEPATPLPAKVYAFEGIGQVIFFEADEVCEVSYKDKKGKYQAQKRITLPKVE